MVWGAEAVDVLGCTQGSMSLHGAFLGSVQSVRPERKVQVCHTGWSSEGGSWAAGSLEGRQGPAPSSLVLTSFLRGWQR